MFLSKRVTLLIFLWSVGACFTARASINGHGARICGQHFYAQASNHKIYENITPLEIYPLAIRWTETDTSRFSRA